MLPNCNSFESGLGCFIIYWGLPFDNDYIIMWLIHLMPSCELTWTEHPPFVDVLPIEKNGFQCISVAMSLSTSVHEMYVYNIYKSNSQDLIYIHITFG